MPQKECARLGLGLGLELSKYCNVSKSNSNKMARAFAEGVKYK